MRQKPSKNCGQLNLGAKLVIEIRVKLSKPTRSAERHHVALSARLTWKDASGAVRFVSVVTRDVSEAGVWVKTDGPANIPLYRLVHVQLERGTRELAGVPKRLRQGRVLSAVWRVGPCQRSTGTPEGYALRFLVDPHEHACEQIADERMPVAS